MKMQEIREVLTHYHHIFHDVNKIAVRQLQEHVYCIDEQYILKEDDNSDLLYRNSHFMQLLRKGKLPLPQPVPSAKGELVVIEGNHYYLLTTKLWGRTLTFSEILSKHELASEIGRVLAKLHVVLRSVQDDMEVWDNSLLDELDGWVRDTFLSKDCNLIPMDSFDQTVADLQKEYELLPKQLIHRDFHIGNLLFQEGVFSGYIDFDLAQRNIRLFDVAYFLLGMMQETGKDETVSEKEWIPFARAFLRGYDEVDPLSLLEKQRLCVVMKGIELLMVAYYLQVEDELHAREAANIYLQICELISRSGLNL